MAKVASGKATRELERRAGWCMREWHRSPTLTYTEMRESIADHFAIGLNAAERVMARAKVLEHESLLRIDLAWVEQQYKQLLELAIAEKKYNTARAILDSIASTSGIANPRSVGVHVTGAVQIQQMAHVAVLALTPTQRAQRQRELEAKAGLRPQPVIDVREAAPAAPPTADDALRAALEATLGDLVIDEPADDAELPDLDQDVP